MIFYEFNYAGMMIEIQVVTKPKLYSASLFQLNNEFNSLIEYVNRWLVKVSQLLTYRKYFNELDTMCDGGKFLFAFN